MQVDLEILKPDFGGLDFAISTFAQIPAFVSTFLNACLSLLIRFNWDGRASYSDQDSTWRRNWSNKNKGKELLRWFCVGWYQWFGIVQKFQEKLELLRKEITPLKEGMREYATQIVAAN